MCVGRKSAKIPDLVPRLSRFGLALTLCASLLLEYRVMIQYEASESGSVWPVKEHFTPYEYAMYEYVDVCTGMYFSRLMECNELCELCDL